MPISTTPMPLAFVIMPFDRGFDDLFAMIRVAAREAGLLAERVDSQVFTEPIVERIHSQIGAARVIVAVLTGQNPNVMYEFGYAAALGKPVVAVHRRDERIPFDVRQLPLVLYDRESEVGKPLRERLEGVMRLADGTRPSDRMLAFRVGAVRLTESAMSEVEAPWRVSGLVSPRAGDSLASMGFPVLRVHAQRAGGRSGDNEYLGVIVETPAPTGQIRTVRLENYQPPPQQVEHEDGSTEFILPFTVPPLPGFSVQLRIMVEPAVSAVEAVGLERTGIPLRLRHYSEFGRREFALLVRPSGFEQPTTATGWTTTA